MPTFQREIRWRVILPPKMEVYNQNLDGVFGEFGTGANTKICYLQTTIMPSELSKITLIADLPDLKLGRYEIYSRDVDEERVKNGLLQYFNDPEKAKFFNPLTLALVPIESDYTVVSDIPELVIGEDVGDAKGIVYEAEDLYKFTQHNGNPKYTRLKWNEHKVAIVAIDGQHRLSALKRQYKDVAANHRDKEFLEWAIPVVVLAVRKNESNVASASLIDVIRNLFLYINDKSQEISDSRKILLSDESINKVCTQELLEYCHENDNQDLRQRDESKVPLFVFRLAWQRDKWCPGFQRSLFDYDQRIVRMGGSLSDW